MSDGMAKNFEVCRDEIAAYCACIKMEWARMKRVPASRKLHVLFGLIPDAHRYMPRTLSYLALLSLLPLLACFAWWWLA